MWLYDLGLVGLFGFVFSFVLGFFYCATELEFRGCTRKQGKLRLIVTVTLLKIFFPSSPDLHS